MNRLISASTLTSLAFVLVASANAADIYGLSTRDQLVRFNSSNPGTLTQAVFINGLSANESLVGIDFRPATGQLYGLGTFGNLYTLNTMTGQASFIAGLTNSVGGGAISLSGVEFGFDFNPTVDRIRLTSNMGQNLRINPLTGVTIVDGNLNGSATSIVGSAYTNNDNNPSTGTTLYNIDSVQDVLTIQNPPNNGTQTTVGSLGVDVSSLVGFDIETVGTTNTAYAAMQPVGFSGSRFYSVNLTTGLTTNLGAIGGNQSSDSLAVRDIAVASAVPEPATMAVLGLGAAALLRRRRKA